MSLCTVSFTASQVLVLRQASTAHVTPGKHASEALCVVGCKATKAGQCRGLVARDTCRTGARHRPEALQRWVRKGRARPAKVGPSSEYTSWLKKRGGGPKKWI